MFVLCVETEMFVHLQHIHSLISISLFPIFPLFLICMVRITDFVFVHVAEKTAERPVEAFDL